MGLCDSSNYLVLALFIMWPLLVTTRLFSFSSPAKGKIPEGFAKIKERQKFFNLDNGLR